MIGTHIRTANTDGACVCVRVCQGGGGEIQSVIHVARVVANCSAREKKLPLCTSRYRADNKDSKNRIRERGIVRTFFTCSFALFTSMMSRVVSTPTAPPLSIHCVAWRCQEHRHRHKHMQRSPRHGVSVSTLILSCLVSCVLCNGDKSS